MATKNVLWAYVNSFATTLLKFIVRWVFIRTIGATYLGINGLYSSILGVLSLSELGIGSAMTYSLYKPVAEADNEKIKSLMLLYKQAYRLIAVVILVLGFAVVPFLKFLIKGADGVDHLILYYLLFLFNTVSSYFVSYKYGLVHADQKNYVINNIHTITIIITSVLQILLLYAYRSFLLYLIISIIVQLFEKIYAYFYVDKLYPVLKEKNAQPLETGERKTIFSNIKALVVHKFGDVAVNQTDNLIISSFLSITLTGLISNYTLIIGTVEQFLLIMFNNISGSLGNLCATSDKEKQYEIFKIYDYIDFWLFGFSSIAFVSLIQPFTKLMWGMDYVISIGPVILIIINSYFVGQRIPLNNMKVARGIFAADQYLAFIQAIVNLISSIIFVKLFGLIGVYMGTILSGLIPTVLRPVYVYNDLFDKPVSDYFIRYASHLIFIILVGFVTCSITGFILINLNIVSFLLAVIVTAVFPNLVFYLFSRKSSEFNYIKNIFVGLIRKKSTAM